MILTALKDFAQSGTQIPPGYAMKNLGFELDVSRDAKGCRLTCLWHNETVPGNAKGRTREVASVELVPNITRSNNPPPMLACDNAQFVLARGKNGSQDDAERVKAEAKRASFDRLLADYIRESSDPEAAQFLAWRSNGCPGLDDAVARLTDFHAKRLDTDLIAISVGSVRIHDKPAAIAFWSSRVQAAADRDVTICLSCGLLKPPVNSLPQSIRGALVPATSTANIALMSVNFPSASRGASGTGLKSSPICSDCASAAVSAFNTLAADESHRWRFGDRATIWWTKGGDFDASVIEIAELERVQAFLKSVSTGEIRTAPAASRFYALTYSGNVARLVIRDWLDVPLTSVLENVRWWFENTSTPSQRRYYPLTQVALAAGELRRGGGGRWVQEPPEGFREALMRTALQGTKPSQVIMLRALDRGRQEVRLASSDDVDTRMVARRREHARFALIRLVYNSSDPEVPMTQHLDDTRSDPAYLSGRIFAVRASLQRRAHTMPGQREANLNSSIVDRFFSLASTQPASVDQQLSALQQQHLAMLRRRKSDPRSAAAATALERSLRELLDRRGQAPLRMSAQEQAAWQAGFYQQQQADIQAAVEHRADVSEDTPSPEEGDH